jgi:hypothetical protein
MRLLVHRKLLPQGQILERKISANQKHRSQRIDQDSEPFEHSSESNSTPRKCQWNQSG